MAAASSVVRVPLVTKHGYGLGLYGLAIAQTAFTVLMIYCYTDVFGLSATQAGWIIFIGSAVDIAVNLVVPWLTSRTTSRFGRYRPYVIYGSGFFALAFAAMFIRPSLASEGLLIYAFVTHLTYRFVYGFILTPYSSLISRMSEDADERASIGSVKAAWSNLGVLTSAYLGLEVIAWLGRGNAATGFTYFAVIGGVIVFVALLVSGLLSREQEGQTEQMAAETGHFGEAMGLILRNPQLLYCFAATVLFFVGYLCLNSSIIYYFKYVRADAEHAKYAVLFAALGGIIAPVGWSIIVRRTSKAATWTAGSAMIVLGCVLISSLTMPALWVVLALYFLIGVGKSSIQMNYYALTADAVDFGHWQKGRRAEAYAFGLLSIMNKVGYSLGGLAMGYALAWAGLRPNVEQTATTVDRLQMMAGYLPAAVIAISGLLMLGFRINTAFHGVIVAELRARSTPSRADAH
ncbi:MFS transporter [Sphingomonas sp.]|uniref:MFS transporter n=1 Tax=Sphingomonas sp. TaxID=28214 RepID=UPI002DD63FDB|nr:glycoside-pentoside-hexuronide (GPH):cation symporter [Sphingomonas sp.]